MAHAKISASKVERVMLCPASFSLEAAMPEVESNAAAQRGTAIHALAEQILLNQFIEETDNDLLRPAKEYADFIKSFNMPARIEVDLTPTLSTIHPYLGGTADAILTKNDQLIVVDLKTGRIPVAATNNTQLMTYALGAYLFAANNTIATVQIIIFQPGIGISQDTVTVDSLMAFQTQLLNAVDAATDPFAPANASNKACKYCRAKPVCPAARAAVMEKAQNEFKDNSLEALIDAAVFASDWADSVKEYAKTQIADGVSGGKWQLKQGRKMVAWANKIGAEAYFAGNPLAFEVKTPAALKKLGVDIPAQYLEEKVAAPSLVCKESDL